MPTLLFNSNSFITCCVAISVGEEQLFVSYSVGSVVAIICRTTDSGYRLMRPVQLALFLWVAAIVSSSNVWRGLCRSYSTFCRPHSKTPKKNHTLL